MQRVKHTSKNSINYVFGFIKVTPISMLENTPNKILVGQIFFLDLLF